MDTSKKIIRGVVNSRGFTITSPITQWDYGWQFIPEIEDLPPTYRLDFSNEEKHGTALPVYCSTDGAEVPTELIDTGKDIWVWYVAIGDGYGITEYKWRIPNKCKPKTEQDEPTPSQQSSIDQLIVRSNEAVEQAEQSASDASTSAQNASADAERAEEARTDAQNYATQAEQARDDAQTYANNASASATASANSASASAQIKADVEDLVDDAQGYAQASAQSATASANSATTAQGYANTASASAQSASTSASDALTYANTASSKASEASTSAQTASTKASEASQSAENALSYKTDAESAKTASQTAQGLAESARDSAITAKDDAESARDDAVQAKTDVQNIADGIDTRLVDVESALIDKAPVITDTASGAIASFSDGADDLPLKSLVVDINPVQDLHGQDSPYPAGGGKNLFENTARTTTMNGVTFTVNDDGTVSASGTATADIRFDLGYWTATGETVIFNGCPNGGGTTTYRQFADYIGQDTGTHVSATPTAGQKCNVRIQIYNGYTANNLLFKPMIRLVSETDGTFAPYENICPISGWDAVTVTVTGGNLFNVRACTPFNNNVTLTFNDDGSLTCENRNNYPIIATNSVVMNLPNGAYTISTDGTLSTNISFYASDDGVNYAWYANGLNESTKNRTVTINKPYVQLRWQVSANSTDTMPPIMFEYGSTYHSYEPYTGRSITIPLGQTVYGGKLDVLSGVLTVDRVMVDLGTLVWTYETSKPNYNFFYAPIADKKKGGASASSMYPYVGTSWTTLTNDCTMGNFGSESNRVAIRDDSYTDVPAFKSAMSGVQLCYELATPIEIQLDSHTLNSLYGVNNIWADSGDTEVEYRADTKAYIAKKIAEAIASLT